MNDSKEEAEKRNKKDIELYTKLRTADTDTINEAKKRLKENVEDMEVLKAKIKL